MTYNLVASLLDPYSMVNPPQDLLAYNMRGLPQHPLPQQHPLPPHDAGTHASSFDALVPHTGSFDAFVPHSLHDYADPAARSYSHQPAAPPQPPQHYYHDDLAPLPVLYEPFDYAGLETPDSYAAYKYPVAPYGMISGVVPDMHQLPMDDHASHSHRDDVFRGSDVLDAPSPNYAAPYDSLAVLAPAHPMSTPIQPTPIQPAWPDRPSALAGQALSLPGDGIHSSPLRDSSPYVPRRQYKIVRGIAGGQATRPPQPAPGAAVLYVPVELELLGASVEEVSAFPWSHMERSDGRRIIRVERRQLGPTISASFLVVGAADDHPEPEPAAPGVDVVEVSCLDHVLDDEDECGSTYYITSVEVVSIVELLIGTTYADLRLRRKEKGRIRLNLMPYWLKRPVSLKWGDGVCYDSRGEFARRIMRYEIRKPRGFDKEVRILPWERLIAALQRALQCYFAEIPQNEEKHFS